MPDEEEFALDPATIKILASDTRLALLRLLRERRMTLTEMAAATSLHKATVLEHLERLHEAGLVKRHDDPERIWVYYELTRRGSRIVNPGRTRFYLLVGAGLLGAAVAVALVAALASLAPPQAPAAPAAMEQDGPRFDFGFEADSVQSLALGSFSSPSSVVLRGVPATPGAAQPVAAFLVPEAQAANVTSGASVRTYRASIEDSGPVLTLRAAGVPPGDYRVYLRDAEGRDNRDAMPAVHVAGVAATAQPATWWHGLDGAATFAVRVDGASAEGNLTLQPRRGGPALALPLAAGMAQAAPEALDALAPGRYELRYETEVASVPAGSFEVRAPQLAASPLEVLAGATTTLRVSVGTGPDTPLNVSLDGARLAPMGRDAGGITYAVTPGAPGALALRVGRLDPVLLRAHPYVRVDAATLPGPQLDLGLQDAAAQPWAGAAVLLDGAAVGTTNASGRLAMTLPAEGERLFTFRLPGGFEVHRALRVTGWNLTEAPQPVTLAPEATSSVFAEATTVAVGVRNDAAAPVPLTLVATLDGAPVAAQSFEAPARGAANATFDAIPVPAGEHALQVQALPLAHPPLAFANRTAPPPPPSPTTPPPSPPTSPPPAGAPATPPSAGAGASPGAPLAPASAVVTAPALTVRGRFLELEAPPAPADLADLRAPSPSAQRQDTAARTPGFEALAAALALAAVVALRRRRA